MAHRSSPLPPSPLQVGQTGNSAGSPAGSNAASVWLTAVQRSRSLGRRPGPRAELTAEPGWRLDLPFEHEFPSGEGREVVAYVTLTAFDGGCAVLVSLTSKRTPV